MPQHPFNAIRKRDNIKEECNHVRYSLTGGCADEGGAEDQSVAVDALQEDVKVQQKSMVLREWMLGRWLELERKKCTVGRRNETSLWCCDDEETDTAAHSIFITPTCGWRSGGSGGRRVTLPGCVDPRGNATADHSEGPATIGR